MPTFRARLGEVRARQQESSFSPFGEDAVTSSGDFPPECCFGQDTVKSGGGCYVGPDQDKYDQASCGCLAR
ncbi:MAG: hypothetical protein AB1758_01915 [Candidatus Eremiobacterota bacterium]